MKPDTQAADVVTAEMVESALDSLHNDYWCSSPSPTLYMQNMRAALIASGLPAEVARLRGEVENIAAEIECKYENLFDQVHAEHKAELSRLRGELSEAGNYVCDKECMPTSVTFTDGRIVRVVGDGYLEIERAK